MMILHVYNVSIVNRKTGEIFNETVCCTYTSEARDLVVKKHNIQGQWPDLVDHIKELTRFEVN